MLKIKNIKSDGSKLHMDVLIEGDSKESYALCVDQCDDIYPVIASKIPAEYKVYERQARVAPRRYLDRNYPETIESEWY